MEHPGDPGRSWRYCMPRRAATAECRHDPLYSRYVYLPHHYGHETAGKWQGQGLSIYPCTSMLCAGQHPTHPTYTPQTHTCRNQVDIIKTILIIQTAATVPTVQTSLNSWEHCMSSHSHCGHSSTVGSSRGRVHGLAGAVHGALQCAPASVESVERFV